MKTKKCKDQSLKLKPKVSKCIKRLIEFKASGSSEALNCLNAIDFNFIL